MPHLALFYTDNKCESKNKWTFECVIFYRSTATDYVKKHLNVFL